MKTLLVCTALLSCAVGAFEIEPGQSLPTTITYVCPSDIQPVLFRMFAEWNAACDGRFTLVEADPDDPAIPNLRILEVSSIEDGAYIGYTYIFPLHAEIHIVSNLVATEMDNTMLHELGHALGLAHSNKDAVMFPVLSAVPKILTADDVSGVRTIYGLPPADFSFKILAKIKRHVTQFSISGSDINNDWITWDFGDGTQVYGSVIGSPFNHWYPRGRYTVTATYLGCAETLSIKIR